MSRIARASFWTGIVLIPLFFAVGIARNRGPLDLSIEIIPGAFLISVFLWFFGATLAFVLLLGLRPIADRLRPWISLLVFVVVGFGLGAWLEFEMLHIGAHGVPPPIKTQPWTTLAFGMVLIGMVGAVCSLASWLSLRRSAHLESPKKTAQPGATDNPDDAQRN